MNDLSPRRNLDDYLRERLFPDAGPGLALVVDWGLGFRDPLWPEELPAVAKACPERRAEFRAARAAARRAIANLGCRPVALPVGACGSPRWPKHLVGSLTHSAQCAMASVAFASEVASLGIDVEPADPLPEDIADHVLQPLEQQQNTVIADQLPELWRTIAFSAKEAFYKAYFPLTEEFVDFPDVHICLTPRSPKSGEFAISPTTKTVSRPDIAEAIQGCWVVTDGQVFCSAVLCPPAGQLRRGAFRKQTTRRINGNTENARNSLSCFNNNGGNSAPSDGLAKAIVLPLNKALLPPLRCTMNNLTPTQKTDILIVGNGALVLRGDPVPRALP